jgi:hypothetical protein
MPPAVASRAPQRSSTSALVAVLDDVTRMRGELEVDLDTALVEIGREEASCRRTIEEGHRRLAALRELRREYEDRVEGLTAEMLHREWEAVRQGLVADRERLQARAAMVAEAVASLEASMNAELAEPELAAALREYIKFREAEASLGAMPADYRAAILAQHRRVQRRLEPSIAAANAGPAPLSVAPAGIGILASADPAEGRPEALVLVLPLPSAVYADWISRKEDLCSQLAYRMVAAVFRLLARIDAADAPVRYLDVHGCLGVQVWLGDHEVEGDMREGLLERLAAAAEEAVDLWGAGVEVYCVWVRPELLGEEPTP